MIMCLNERYQEILRLDKMLTEAEIPHELVRYFDGWQIIYPGKDTKVADVIEHCASLGREEDKLEIMGLLTDEESKKDDVLGGLTAEEVFARIKEQYTSRCGKDTSC